MLHSRLCLRRAALRVLSSSPSSLSIKSRSITYLAAPISRLNTQRTTFLPFQRRWASEEAVTQQEPEADGAKEAQHGRKKREQTFADRDADIHDLEPATQSEETTASSSLETATDSAKEHASAAASQVSDAAQSATETVTGAAQSLGAAAGFGSPRNPENPGGSRGNAPALDGEPSPTVYVGNLYFDVRSEDLKQEFERAGPIDEAKVIMDHRGLSKGYSIPQSPVPLEIPTQNSQSASKPLLTSTHQIRLRTISRRRRRNQSHRTFQPPKLRRPPPLSPIFHLSWQARPRQAQSGQLRLPQFRRPPSKPTHKDSLYRQHVLRHERS